MTSSVKMVTLTSHDGEAFDIPINVAEQSKLIKNMIDDDVGDSSKIVPLDKVNCMILAKVIEFCEKHAKAANDERCTEELKTWDAEFLKLDYFLLFEIMPAANYMETKSLSDSACQAIADSIENIKPEQMTTLLLRKKQ